MPNLSFWEKDTFFKDIDFVVIGSGIVGLHAALRLKEKHPKRRVVVLERGGLPTGASTKNAGFACFGSLTELADDLENQTENAVLELVEKRWRGLQKLRERCGDAAMEYQHLGGTEIFREEEETVFRVCKEKMAWFNDRVGRITGNSQTYRLADDRISEYGFAGVRHLIFNAEEGQIHTGRMMRRLLQIAKVKGVEIFNGITVTETGEDNLSPKLLTSDGWEIRAEKILVTVNGFAKKLLPELPVQPARNQVIITEPVKDLPFRGCFHYDEGYFYFRNVGNRVLLGGGRHLAKEAENTDAFGSTELILNALRGLLREVILPGRHYRIADGWSGILGVGESKTPIVRMISDNIGTAVRLGGMGVAIGSILGEEAADMMDNAPEIS